MGLVKQVALKAHRPNPFNSHISQINLCTSAIKLTKTLPSARYCLCWKDGLTRGIYTKASQTLPKGIFFWHKK